MTMTLSEIALTAVYDAMALAGPGDDATGFIRTSTADTYLGGERLTLAREVLKHLPPGTTAATAQEVALTLVPVVRAALAR